MSKLTDKRLFLPVIFITALLIALALAAVLEDPLLHLREIFVVQYFAVSAFVYVVILALSVPLLPFTVAPLIPFVSKIFTPGATMALSVVGYLLGSLLAYTLARYSGRNFVTRIFPEKRLHDYELLYKNAKGLMEKLALRFFSSADTWSYTAGLKEQAMGWKSFITISVIGSLPSIFILTYSAGAITGENRAVSFSLFFTTTLIALSYLYIRILGRDEKPVKIYTHDWNFHSDDVFAVAALTIMHDQLGKEVKVVRTRDEQVLAKAKAEKDVSKRFIVDVGAEYDPDRNFFDHHQTGGAGKRENDVPYASIGLVWKKFGTFIAGDELVARRLDEKIFQYLDMDDNGKEIFTVLKKETKVYAVPDLIEGTMRPVHGSGKEDYDRQFEYCVKIAKEVIRKEIEHIKKKIELEVLAEGYYHSSSDKEIIVTEQKLSRSMFTKFPDVLFVVSPRTIDPQGEWGVATIPDGEGMFTARSRFPVEWAGKTDGELQKISGIKDAKFCHHSGSFIAGAKSRAGAIKMAEIALERMHKGEDKEGEK